ncbi:unnamed protein product [Rhizoctonia solani]|uniref:Ricin B lectin domain-containing protein n=1 Tax=Rhizoctonia solani TaxID=456999 RepID=A0A8H2XF81_9AGAM|nr:unnamed protein product [Rhizoctonia solani]
MSAFSGVYRITNVESGTVLTMTDPRQPIVCATTDVQDKKSLWRFTLQPDGGYRLTNEMYGLQTRIDNYTNTKLFGAKYGGHVWSIRNGAENEYIIHSGVSSYVVGLPKVDQSSETSVQVSFDKAARYQRWGIEKASESDRRDPSTSPGIYVITSTHTGTAIGLKPGSQDGVFSYEPDGSTGQQWDIQPSGNSNYMTIRSVATNAYVAFPDFEQGAVLELSPAPRDYVIAESDTGFCIAPAEKPDFVVDLTAGRAENGTEIILWENHGRENQRWFFQPPSN